MCNSGPDLSVKVMNNFQCFAHPFWIKNKKTVDLISVAGIPVVNQCVINLIFMTNVVIHFGYQILILKPNYPYGI